MTERQRLKSNDQTVRTSSFDDERTLSTARQVVPLQLVGTNLKRKRTYFLVGCFALAILMGTASGLVSAYFELREVSESPLFQLDALTADASEQNLASTMSEESLNRGGFFSIQPTTEQQLPEQVTAQRIISKPKAFIRKPSLIRVSANRSVRTSPRTEDEDLRRIREELLLNESKKGIQRPERGGQ